MNEELREIQFTLNGQKRSITVNPIRRLLDVLRDDLELTGTKEGCGEGECGACSVIIDGRLMNSCILAVGVVEGASVETIEGVRETPRGAQIIEEFGREGAVQCGFCIPGMVVATDYLLRRNSSPSEEDIRQGISGNLCRCTGYDRIVAAIAGASRSAEG
ncbi:MAG: (2Fe-2S)-binding protein [Alkalispirochaetaceae bacterium]